MPAAVGVVPQITMLESIRGERSRLAKLLVIPVRHKIFLRSRLKSLYSTGNLPLQRGHWAIASADAQVLGHRLGGLYLKTRLYDVLKGGC